MTHIYLFDSEQALTKKIDELKIQKVPSSDMTVSANNRPDSVFLNYRDIEFVKADGSIWEKLVGKMFDRDSKGLVLRRFNLTERERAKYKKGINSGHIVLLVKGDVEVEKDDEDLNLDEIYDEYGLNSEKS